MNSTDNDININSESIEKDTLAKNLIEKFKSKNETVKCKRCLLYSTVVIDFLKIFKYAIGNLIDTLCSILPIQIEKPCVKFNVVYIKSILNLVHVFTPLDVCQFFEYCPLNNTIQNYPNDDDIEIALALINDKVKLFNQKYVIKIKHFIYLIDDLVNN